MESEVHETFVSVPRSDDVEPVGGGSTATSDASRCHANIYTFCSRWTDTDGQMLCNQSKNDEFICLRFRRKHIKCSNDAKNNEVLE
jgi:hypothetical protein